LARKTANGKSVDLSDNVEGNSAFTISFDISLPLKNGGTWGQWNQYSATTSFLANSGTYKLAGPSQRHDGTHSAFTTLIEKLRAAQRH
jgi:hypothetical protein